MSQDFGQMTKELTGAQQEISEKIHTENVKCYRKDVYKRQEHLSVFLILNKNIFRNSGKTIDFLDKFHYITILETL